MHSLIFYRFRLLLIAVVLFFIWQTVKYISLFQSSKVRDIDHPPDLNSAINPVLASVYYEALCPDSKNFIIKQLQPAMNIASRLLNITLIPYGKAKTFEYSDGSISFTCQHGPTECLANKIHACAISHIPYSPLQISFISCMISDNFVPQLIGEKCAIEFNVDWKSIVECAQSEKGSILLKENGKLTDALRPSITFVPTVLLDNKHGNQADILKDFLKQVCLLFEKEPEECECKDNLIPM